MTLWYNQNRGVEEMSPVGVIEQVSGSTKKGRPRKTSKDVQSNNSPNGKGENEMSDQVNEQVSEQESTTSQDGKVKRIQRTVFDVASFDDITLYKDVMLPEKPKDLREALAILENKEDIVVELIYQGMVQKATDAAWNQMAGFCLPNEENKDLLGKEYDGKYADSSMREKINAAVLSIAKMQGYSQDLTPERKKELKENAKKFIRDNPAMYSSL